MSLADTLAGVRQSRRHEVQAGPWRMATRVLGRPGAPPVVLVHGLGMSSLYLLPTAVRLARDFEVWLPELPGFGHSSRPPRALTIPQHADALATFLEVATLGPVPLLGNSLGCQVIVDLAVRYPELVARLVLAGPTVDPAARTMVAQGFRLLRDAPREHLSLAAVALYDYLRSGPLRFVRTFQHALRDPIAEKLLRVHQPALVVRGSRDPVVPQRWAEEVARLLPGGRIVVLQGAPHGVNYSAPDGLARVAGAFIKEQGSILH